MRQPLWIVNSALLTIVLCTMVALLLLASSYRFVLTRPLPRPPALVLPEPVDEELFSKIYEEDLFDTKQPPAPPEEEKAATLDMPEPPQPQLIAPPEPQEPAFVDPLKVTLRGIMYSSMPDRCMALIEDEAAKEKTFVRGEKINDGQLIKIARDRVVLLRTGGQHETLYLRPPVPSDAGERNWARIVKMINPATYELDLDNFKKEVSSLGQLFEALGVATAFVGSKPIGLRIASIDEQDLGMAMGLQNGDILTQVDDISLATLDDRVSAFARLGQLGPGQQVTIQMLRSNAPMQLTYTMTKLAKATPPPFGRPPEGSVEKEVFQRSPMQQRQFAQQQFDGQHRSQDRETVLGEIRRRVLENMKMRERNLPNYADGPK